ncbi:MAG: hypothetical protein WCA35_18060 [Kovacikia sp.]
MISGLNDRQRCSLNWYLTEILKEMGFMEIGFPPRLRRQWEWARHGIHKLYMTVPISGLRGAQTIAAHWFKPPLLDTAIGWLVGTFQAKSTSLMGRSSLQNSLLAATSTNGIVICFSSLSAAANAAFKATLIMLPPVKVMRANQA